MPSPVRPFAKIAERTPLRLVLIIPFVAQILLAVGLTGYFSILSGRAAVNQATRELREEITDRIIDKLTSQLEISRFVVENNANAIQQGFLPSTNLRQLKPYLLNQLQQSRTLTAITISTQEPDYIQIGTEDTATSPAPKFLIEWDKSQGGVAKWQIDSQGNPQSPPQRNPTYDHRQRPWYRNTLQANRLTWSDPFLTILPQQLIISAHQPIYNAQNQVIGVASADLNLKQISYFLNHLEIGKTGKTFIIERNGELIANSSSPVPFAIDPTTQKPVQLKAIHSPDRLIQDTAQHLTTQFPDLNNILSQTSLQFTTPDGQKQFLQIVPYQIKPNINWIIIVVIPEADFTEQIQANTRNTILLCLIASLIAIAFGILTSRWITRPLLQLSQAARAIARGDWKTAIQPQCTTELRTLATAFNEMHHQLQSSHEKLADNTHRLEQKNQQLETLEAELRRQLNLFLHAVSHDLRNPVIGTSMVLNNLSQQAGDTIQIPRKTLQQMQESNQRQLDLINSLIEAHAVETWGITIHPQPIDLNQLAKEAIADLQPLIDKEQAALINQIPLDLPLIDADPLQLIRVYQNLIINAIKHNLPHLTVTLTAQTDKQYIYCSVSDNGNGIALEQQKNLFNPYFRGSYKPRSVGLGLGLYLCQQIIQAHKGEIKVSSQLGEGTTFIFKLPISHE
jgi:signal transduction histidine kinase